MEAARSVWPEACTLEQYVTKEVLAGRLDKVLPLLLLLSPAKRDYYEKLCVEVQSVQKEKEEPNHW